MYIYLIPTHPRYLLYDFSSNHTERETFISICLQKGMPIRDVMKMSRLSDFKSMKPNIRITRKDIMAVADRWNI